MSRRPPKSAEVDITHFSKKGHGIGKSIDQAQLAEVPFTIPGDRVRALVQRKRSGVSASRLEEIISPSPLRIEPRCIHFGSCGGCRWQQMSYEDQLKTKQSHVEKLFLPLMHPETVFHPILACDPPWQYRNKMEFSFSSDSSGRKFLGLIMDSSRGKVLNLTECHLVNPWFIDAIKCTRAWWLESGLSAYHPHSNTGALRTLTVREGIRTGDRLLMLTVSGNPEFAIGRNHLDSFVAFARDAVEPLDPSGNLSIFLRIQQAIKGSETTFFEMQLYGPDHIREILYVQTSEHQESSTLTFDISPSAFFQPNTRQAEKLYGAALQLLDIPAGSIVYDLYCGTGTLGICAAKEAKQVIGIEISPESSLDARANALKNNLENVHILTGSVSEVMQTIRQGKLFSMPDVVMVDPPRAGLDGETIKHLAELRPAKLLYISCNPATQAENIKELQSMGYRLVALQPVDQFPHTVHIENIAILTYDTKR